jgi:UDP-N-acetylglucosamine 2-epimerase (non-hydrolysing)/UDP-GlcNAc3NAcA epimerase
MRSYDRRMPEELNRVLTDHASSLLLCSAQAAVDTLRAEQVVGEVVLVGDVMVDVFELLAPRADTAMLERLGVVPGDYLLATAHRAGNVDDPARLRALVDVLTGMPLPVVLPLHPRTHARLADAGLLGALDGVVVAPPLGYLEFAGLLVGCRAVLTDSGGVQKEAYLAGKPCITLRDTTEWRETVEAGWNVLVDLDRASALDALERPVPAERPPLYGDGRAGERVVEALVRMAG